LIGDRVGQPVSNQSLENVQTVSEKMDNKTVAGRVFDFIGISTLDRVHQRNAPPVGGKKLGRMAPLSHRWRNESTLLGQDTAG